MFLHNINIDYYQKKRDIGIYVKLYMRRYSRQSLGVRILLVILFLFGGLTLFLTLVSLVFNITTSSSFLENNKCPACYGFKACERLQNYEITPTGYSNFWGLFDRHSIKYGKTSDGLDVILSKLGDKNRTAKWESMICAKAKQKSGCDVSRAAQLLFPLSGSKWIIASVKGQSLMTMCPTQRMVDSMQFRYMETLDEIDTSARERAQMVLTLWISQEPLIYQMFEKSKGWPFPEYLGACGRVVVYESPGEPLYYFINDPWEFRAKIAIKILRIAQKLTHNPSMYGLYVMRVNYQTFHVKRDTEEVFYTSPEDVLVVDRYDIEKDQKKDWDVSFIRNSTQCTAQEEDPHLNCQTSENWLQFNELCTRHYSDHNFYAICRNIFSPTVRKSVDSVPLNVGLLHSVPKNLDLLFGLNNLINRCTHPEPGDSREDIVSRIIQVLHDNIYNVNEPDEF